MALYIVQVPDPPLGVDWLTAVPGQYLYNVTGITAILSTGIAVPTVCADASGNGYDLAYSNPNVAYGVAGYVTGDTMVTNTNPFSGNVAAGPIPDLTWMTGNDLYFNAWTDATPGPGLPPPLVEFNDTAHLFYFFFNDTGGAGNFTMILVWDDGGLGSSAQTTGPYVAGRHMFTARLDLGAAAVQFYVDGAPFGGLAPWSNGPPVVGPAGSLKIGGKRFPGLPTHYDEIAVGANVTTDAFWANLYAQRGSFAAYNAAQQTMFPQVYYHLDETSVSGGRQVALNITDGTKRVALIPTGFAEVATPGPYAYSWVPRLGNAAETPDGTTVTVPTPPLVLPAGYSIGTNTLDLAPTDQWSQVRLWWDSNIMDAQAAQSAYLFPPPVHLVYHQEPH